MKDIVRCGVIGAGWWGTTAHIPALLRHPKAGLVAVHHRDEATAHKIADHFEVPQGFSSVDQLLETDGLDAVVVSSAPYVHYEQARAALARGLHVLIEKPMTMTAAQAQELVEMADAQDLQFLVSGPWHFTEHAAEAQHLIQSGELGDIKMISVLMTNYCLNFYRGLSWDEIYRDTDAFENASPPYLKPEPATTSIPEIAGGGQIYCQVSHVGAHLALLTGQGPAEVFARFDNHDTPIDVYDTLNVKLDRGTLVSIASTGATMDSERNFEVRVYGTDGMLFMELWKGNMQLHRRDGKVRDYPDLPADDIYPLHAPVINLVDAVTGDAPNKSPARLGWQAMKLIEASCESVRSGKNVMIG